MQYTTEKEDRDRIKHKTGLSGSIRVSTEGAAIYRPLFCTILFQPGLNQSGNFSNSSELEYIIDKGRFLSESATLP